MLERRLARLRNDLSVKTSDALLEVASRQMHVVLSRMQQENWIGIGGMKPCQVLSENAGAL